jgi:lipoprotein-releasing system permease protein
MNLRLIAEIARSLMLARFKQTMVASVGVTFSITLFITLLSFMTGLNMMLDSLIVNRTPHIRLYNEIKPSEEQPLSLHESYKGWHHFIHSIKPKRELTNIRNSLAIMQSLKHDSRVSGVAPKLTEQVIFTVGTVDLTGIINGIEPEEENRLFFFNDYVTTGNALELKHTPNSILLGKGAAEKMMVEPGDVINVTTSKGNKMQLKVVGIFQSGLADFDKVNSYTSIATAQKMIGESSDFITDIQVKLHDINLAPAVAREYHQVYGTDAQDIQSANAQFETGTFIRTLISYTVGITLLIVAGFGIYNILNMMIYEKMDTIAILKATGFNGMDVKMIFIGIALIIGISGGLAGLVLGFGLSSIIDQIPFRTQALPTITTYPVNYNPAFYVIGIVFSIITTYLSGYFPARKASRIDPVVTIRGK